MPGALRRSGDEHLRAGDQLEAARMMLADPGLVIIEPVEMLQELEIPLHRQGRVLVVVMERRHENAALQIKLAHADASGRNAHHSVIVSHRGRFRQANFPAGWHARLSPISPGGATRWP